MKRKCSKCGSVDIHTMHRTADEAEFRHHGDKPRPESKFATVRGYSVIFTQECLDHHCRNCGYEWETATLDAKAVKG